MKDDKYAYINDSKSESSTNWDDISDTDNEEGFSFKKFPGQITEDIMKKIDKKNLIQRRDKNQWDKVNKTNMKQTVLILCMDFHASRN